MGFRCSTAFLIALLGSGSQAEDKGDRSPAGVYKAEAVARSPKMAASGIVWHANRLVIADRGGKRLVAFTPPEKFETLADKLTPVGVAVDPDGQLVVVDRDEPPRLLRFTADGKRTAIVAEEIGTPQFLAVHKTGTIFWSGFPDGGTRSFARGGNQSL